MRKPDPTAPIASSVSSLLRVPNPWAEWMNDREHEPLIGLRYMALVLRELPPPWLIERLAPALLDADVEGQQLVEQHLRDAPMPKGMVFGFENWLSFWDLEGREPYEQAVLEIVGAIDGTDDLRLFSKAMTSEALDQTELLWFLLNGMAEWAAWNDDPQAVGQGGAWLVELLSEGLEETVDWPKKDPLGFLFAFLYNRFRESTLRSTMPIPNHFVSREDPGRYFSAGKVAPTSDDKVLLAVTSTFDETDLKLNDVLGDDARIWPRVAASISSLRRSGLLSTTSLRATPAGKLHANLERDDSGWPERLPQPKGGPFH